MLLTADSSFYHELCGSSVNVAVREMLSFLAEVNLMFQNTDFDENLIPDNIGLKVKEIRIFTTPVFPFEYSFHSKNYLELFSVMSHSKLCLSLAFTYRTFIDSVLGISWIANPREDPPGGICAGKYSRRGWLNTLAVNMKTISGNAVSHQEAALNVAHEIGHSFGSLHDNVSCSGNSLHTMAPISPQKASFSVCSRRRMLQVMRSNGGCLTKKYSFSFCGNGLVEQGEECDCGLVVDCLTRDPCCIARGGRSHACLVNREAGHECHPSQGPCCLPNCRNRDLAHLGLNCSEENRGCPCTGDSTCSCGLLGRCLSGDCHNIECTRLGLKECPCKYPENHCGTCCLSHEGTCIPAIHLTEPAIRSGNVSLISLRQPPSTAPPYSIRTVKVCHFTNCLNVSFRIWEKGGFCVHLGKLGVCSKDGLCDVSRPIGSTFPDFSTSDRLMSVNVGVLKQIANIWLSICLFVQLIDF